MTSQPTLTDSLKTVLLGVVCVALAVCFWYSIVGNPIDELALIQRAQVATCVLKDKYEEEVEDERRIYLLNVGIYAFQTPDGREFQASTREPTGELAMQLEVEYLPEDPAVNRIKGEGCASVGEWLWRKLGLGSLLLAMFLSPGIVLLRDGIRDIRSATRQGTPVPPGGTRRAPQLASRDQAMEAAAALDQGRRLLVEKRMLDALDQYDRGIALLADDGHGAAPYVERGMILEELKCYSDAIDDYSKAVELDPGDPNTYFQRATCRFALRQMEGCNEDMRRAIAAADPLPAEHACYDQEAQDRGYADVRSLYESFSRLYAIGREGDACIPSIAAAASRRRPSPRAAG
jgi:tetratricopeptide (TPR) repeat protein